MLKKLFSIFIIMFKIGLITFGGGFAMIAIIERELIEKRNWISHEEFLDVVAIAESTPGPIAINSATYIGYKRAGVLGSIFATLGVVLPSFIIIFTISFFYERFLSLTYVAYAFMGIRVCVAFLILSAGIKMLKKLKKNVFNIIIFSVVTLLMVFLTVFYYNFSTILYILAGGIIGLVVYLICSISKKQKNKHTCNNNSSQNTDKEGDK